MQKLKQASASTNYRFKISNRSKQLVQFCHFRNQYENYIEQSQITELKKVYQHGICGRNQKGSLVVVDRLGCIKVNQINKILDQEAFIGYFNQRLLNISENILSQKQQICWVIDLQGKIMQLASKKTISMLFKLIENVQKHFPQILYKMYLVNTPMLFDTIFNKFSGQINEVTLDKIVMLGDQLDTLYEQVQRSMLPDFLGGEIDEESFLKGFQINRIQKITFLKDKQEQKQQEQDQEEQQQQFDFSSLKNALSGMKMGGSHLQSVSQTPLNTEADEK